MDRRMNKKGFAQVLALIGGVMAVVFSIVFAYIFFTNLTSTNLLAANSNGANASNNLIGNFTTGVNNVATAIPTVFQIGVFVLIIAVLIVAYVVARKNGLLGGGQLG